MDLKLFKYFCLAFCFLGVKCQRGWGSNGGYNSGFSNSWNSQFPSGNLGSSGSREQNGFKNIVENSMGSVNPFRGSSTNTGFRESNSFYSKKPSEGFQSFGSDKNFNNDYKTVTNGQIQSSGNSINWQSDEFNRRPNEKKSSFITDSSSSFEWNTNTDYNMGSPASNSGKPSSNINNNQNFRPQNWNSNALNSNNLYNNNVPLKEDFSDSDYEKNSVISSWNSNNKKKLKPTPTSYGGFQKWETTTVKSKKNSEASKWEAKNNNKPKQPSGNNNWNRNTSSTFEKDKTPVNPTDKYSGLKPSSTVTSILDELDKNDWYFGKESNYPKPPFKSPLNIDVSQLWNLDKNKKKASDKNFRGSNNKRRNNRQIQPSRNIADRIQCECVSVDSCDEKDMILTKKDIKHDLRPLEAFMCEDLTEVCCTNPKFKVNSKTNFMQKNNQLHCGQRGNTENPFGKFNINVAEPGEFPWILAVENSENNCSATLIHHKLALTAAQCVAGAHPSEIIVKAGIWNFNDEPPQTRKVARIIPHPDFDIQNPRNDIALLVIETPFELTENVNTVCLPMANDKWESSQCVVAGWRSEEVDGQLIEVLEKGVVNFLPQAECQNIMLVTDFWRNYILHDSFVCGLEKIGSQSCKKSKGSFLICPKKKQPDVYLQIGVVSKGMNCDNFGRPGIFTNVLKFLDWINQNYFELELFDDIDIRSLN